MAKSGGTGQGVVFEPRSDVPPGLEGLAHLIHRGSELLRDGKTRDAEAVLERALRLFPRNPTARHLLALAWLRSGQLERALALVSGMLEEHPDSTAAKVNLAVVLLKLGRASDARPLLEDVVRARPDHHRAWGYLGATLEQLGYIADAESAFVAGHFATAAKRLRDRHPDVFAAGALVTDDRGSLGDGAVPAFPRRTVALEPRASSSLGDGPGMRPYDALPRFTATLRPPDFPQPSRDAGDAGDSARDSDDTGPLGDDAVGDEAEELGDTGEPPEPSPQSSDDLQEIALEETVTQFRAMPPPTISGAPKPSRPVVPLLDAALSSLLVVPQEAEVVAHASGLVMAGLVARDGGAGDGGFVARKDVIHAFAGGLRRRPLPHRAPPAPEPFRGSPFVFNLLVGTGQLILAPPRHTRLLPLQMDADVAFVREELVVAFDDRLLCDLGRLGRPSASRVSLVRFRGDGVIVLALDAPFLAFDVRGTDCLTLRAATLVGWVGSLIPEPVPGDDDLLAFDGEGTVLFLAPSDK